MPRVSVIIPAYNSADTIAATIASIAGQTYEDWEIVVGDDASTDDTAAVARAADPRVTVVTGESNGGPAAGRNLAVEVAQGELLALLDADDRWLFEAAPDSLVATKHREYDRSLDNGAVAIVPPSCVAQLAGVARLEFAPDLSATVRDEAPARVVEAVHGRAGLATDDGARLLCRGWSAPERVDGADLRWAEGPLAMLALPLPRDRAFQLAMRVIAAPGLRAEQQWIAVSVDGHRVLVARVPKGGGEIEALVPDGTTRGPVSVVTLEFADWLGRDAGPDDDGPRSAGGVEWIAVD